MVDETRRNLLQLQMPERRVEVNADRRAVVVECGPFALAVELLPAQPLMRCLGERRAGANHPGQRARARLRQQLVEDRLGRTAGEVAGGRTAAPGPRGPQAPLDLATVGQAELDVPLRAAGPLDEEGVAGDGAAVHPESLKGVHRPTVSRGWEDFASRICPRAPQISLI